MAKSLDDLRAQVVTPAPTPGQGLALDAAGNLPLSIRQQLSGYRIGYDSIAVSVLVVSVSEAAPTTVIACAGHTFDGGAVKVRFQANRVSVTAGDLVGVALYEGGVELARTGLIQNGSANPSNWPIHGEVQFTPTAGSHSYVIGAWSTLGSASTIVAADIGSPVFVEFMKA